MSHNSYPPIKSITRARAAVLRALHQLELERGHPPTVRELKSYLGLSSTATVYRHLEVLRNNNLVIHKPNTIRGWQSQGFYTLKPYLQNKIA